MNMLTFFAALCHKVANSSSSKLSVSAIIDDMETVGADSWRTNVGDMKKNRQLHRSPKYSVSMLTFFADLCHKLVNSSSLKLSVSAIIDDVETVSSDLERASIRVMKKINNRIDPLNMQ